jgi:NADH:ubiquinone oxidoreductase subunit 5 (subunit L)/multisubunit Na+/H+ antiporter MnhA subunit
MRIYTIKAALKTFIFSRISDMFMFFSFTCTVVIFNTTDLSLIFTQIPFLAFHYIFIGNLAIHFLTLFSSSVALTGIIKAAQFFFHV